MKAEMLLGEIAMMKRLLSGMLAALFAFPSAALAACSPDDTSALPESPGLSGSLETPETPETPQPPETGVIVGSPIEISAETEREIVQAWLAAYPSDGVTADELSPDVRGVFGDVYVLYMHGPFGASDVITKNLVGNVLFEYPSSLTLTVYREGAFSSLPEAYRDGLLGRDDLLTLQKNYNNGWYWSTSQTIKEDYVREHDGVTTEELSLRVHYLCGMNNAVLFVDGGGDYPAVETQQEVDGVVFEYLTAQQLLFYGDYDETDSMFCDLETAFACGALDHDDLLAALANYAGGIQISVP